MGPEVGEPCLVPECGKPRKRCSDYCPGHTHRLRRYGSPTGMPSSRYSADAAEKRCTRCKKSKGLADFSPMKNGQLGLKPKCKDCEAEVARIRRRNEAPEQRQRRLKQRRYERKLQYGERAAKAWYQRVIVQGLGCEVCGTVEEDIGIDHDHSCGKHPPERGCDDCFRGILCSSCNGSLGMLREDPDRMLALLSYLLTRGEVMMNGRQPLPEPAADVGGAG